MNELIVKDFYTSIIDVSNDYFNINTAVICNPINPTVTLKYVKTTLFDFKVITGERHYRKDKYNAFYAIMHKPSCQVYFGSSGHIMERLRMHTVSLKCNKNSCHKLQELFNKSKLFDFDIIIVFTISRDEAFDLEQLAIDYYINTSFILNTAINSRFPSLGMPATDERKKNMAIGRKGKKHSIETINWLKENNHKRYRPVVINGVKYPGLRYAGRELNIDNCTLRHRILSDDVKYKDYLYDD